MLTVDPRDEAPQYVLPLVVRVERADPPARTDALEAAALAVLTLLTDPRTTGAAPPGSDTPEPGPRGSGPSGPGPWGSGPRGSGPSGPGPSGSGVFESDPWGSGPLGPGAADDPDGVGRPGEWAAVVRAWADARIRKVVRRARGAEWRRAGVLDGITVARGTAEVRVFPPVQLDGWPRDLAKLQVSGTELADPQPPAEPGPGVPVIWLAPAPELTAGKAMAQVGHAAQLGLAALDPAGRERWRQAGFPLAVRTATPARWAGLVRAGLPVVRDAGFTEVAPGTCTAVAELRR